MTDKSNDRDAPQEPSFAEKVRTLDSIITDSDGSGIGADLLTCIREQQAALDRLLERSEAHIFGDECKLERDAARAVLARWRIE